MNYTKRVTVLTLSYNESENVFPFMRNLIAIFGKDLDLVVVDNDSKDGTPLLFEACGAKVVKRKTNIGTPAINDGLRYCKREFVFFMGNDCLPDPDCIKKLVQLADEMPEEKGLFSPWFLNQDRSIQFEGSWLDKITWYAGSVKEYDDRKWLDGGYIYRPEPFEIPFSGCGLINRRTIEEIGGYIYKPGYFLYGEDVELGLRLKRCGYKTLIYPVALVVHAGSASKKWFDEATLTYYCERNMLRNYWEYGNMLFLPFVVGSRIFRAGYNVMQGKYAKAQSRMSALATLMFGGPSW